MTPESVRGSHMDNNAEILTTSTYLRQRSADDMSDTIYG